MNEEFFKRDYIISGKHGQQVVELKNDKDDQEGVDTESKKLFNRNVDIFLLAPIVGFIYNRRVEKDNDTELKKVTINSSQLINEKDRIEYNYQLIMLIDEKYEPDFNKRVDKAFRYSNPEDLERFNSYIRGGIEILHEKIIKSSPTSEYYIDKFYEFIDEFQSVYNKDITTADYKEIFG